jgi:hypothetical protein
LKLQFLKTDRERESNRCLPKENGFPHLEKPLLTLKGLIQAPLEVF